MSVAANPTSPPTSEPVHPLAHQLPEPTTEARYLAEQAATARANMGSLLHRLAHQLTIELSPRGWIRRHPWTSMAAAAGAGAGLGLTLTSKRSGRAARRTPPPTPLDEDRPPTARRMGFARPILVPLFASIGQAAKVALDRFLIGLVESALATATTSEAAGAPNAAQAEAHDPEQEAPTAG